MNKEKYIVEIMYLALLVQTHTEYCVFIDMLGHVNWLEIKIRKSKHDYNTEVANGRIYINHEFTEARAVKIKAILTDILEKGQINYDLCECDVQEIVRVERYYSF